MSTPELLALVRDAFNRGIREGMREHTSSRGGDTWVECGPALTKRLEDILSVAQQTSQSHACLTCCGDGKVSSGYSNRPYDECPDCNGTGRGPAHDKDVDSAQCAPQPSGEQARWPRSMDTAPRDGTEFIAHQGDDVYKCQWREEERDEGPPYAGWYDFSNQSFEEPTAWQLLTLPPEADNDPHGDGHCGCTERCKDRDNCQYDKPLAWQAEREAVARAIFGDGWKCCGNLGPYVQSVANELHDSRQLLAMFDPELVEKYRAILEEVGKIATPPVVSCAPSGEPAAVHPVNMTNQQIAQKLDDYRRWTVLEPETEDLLTTTAQRLRAVPCAARDALLRESRQFVADAGCDEDDSETNAHRDDLLRRIDAIPASAVSCAAREALEKIAQRANESGTGEMGLLDTIHAIHRIATTALPAAGGEASKREAEVQEMLRASLFAWENNDGNKHTVRDAAAMADAIRASLRKDG